jgi:chemotaxis signal transduction protein
VNVASNSSSSGAIRADEGPAATGLRLTGGLQCRIGRARVAIPIESVARIIEYQVVPLPLSRPWIGGLGIHEGTPLVSIALVAPDGEAAARTTTTGILLTAPGSLIGWALEINEMFAFVRATVLPRRAESAADKLPLWITRAVTDDGKSLGWISVGEMLADLGRVAEAQP